MSALSIPVFSPPSHVCRPIIIQGLAVICPDWLPEKGWSLNNKGYPIYTSRRTNFWIGRGEKMARVIIRVLLEECGLTLDPAVQVHHADHKLINCPLKLIVLPPELH